MPALLDPREAADYLNVSPSWLERAVRAGVVPSARLGRLRRFRRCDLDNYIASCVTGST